MVFPPMVSPRFRVEGAILQYKPYPSYPTWLTAWDLTSFLTAIGDSIAAETARAIDQETQLASQLNTVSDTAYAAEFTANQALIDAATAYGFAEVANIAVEDLQIVVNALDVRVTALENP